MIWTFEPWPVVSVNSDVGELCAGKLTIVSGWNPFECWIAGGGQWGTRSWPGAISHAAYPTADWHPNKSGTLEVIVDVPGPASSDDILWGQAQIAPDGQVFWEYQSDDASCRDLAQGLVYGIAAALQVKPPKLIKGEVYSSVKVPRLEEFFGVPGDEVDPSIWTAPARSWHVLTDTGTIWRALEKDCIWETTEQESQRALVAHVIYSDSAPNTGGLLVKDRQNGLRFWPDRELSLIEPPVTEAIPEAALRLGQAMTFLS